MSCWQAVRQWEGDGRIKAHLAAGFFSVWQCFVVIDLSAGNMFAISEFCSELRAVTGTRINLVILIYHSNNQPENISTRILFNVCFDLIL